MYMSTHSQTKSSHSTVLSSVVSGFVNYTQNQGVDVYNILERSALSIELLESPNNPAPLGSLIKAFDLAAYETQNDNFGLWLGNMYAPEELGIWGYVGLTSNTLRDALHNMVDFFPYYQGKSSLKLSSYQGKISIEYTLLDGSILSKRHDAELTLGIIMNVIRRACGSNWSPLEVHFKHPAPQAWREHSRAFNSEIYFNQIENAIILEPTDLNRPMPGADPHLLQILIQSFKSLWLMQPLAKTSLTERVKSTIVDVLPNEIPKLENIADNMNMPSWTLKRKLKQENRTFSSLLDEVRKELADNYLMTSELSMSQISEKLGYKETSSFSHSFSRWYDCSPKDWRSKNK
ncbi:hypothetical protein BA893_19225 [Vibrio natriegens]|uniref:AraC-like transcriptional regulator QhpR n=1 Tax=Vibrio natriegens TaxID=691 RepID=UPI000803FE24|nr:AraC family transcriptional regulator [Vibrio natriegens]ANQ23770.1 hypothetical protein BA893_19225 [Vibrio natriegens]